MAAIMMTWWTGFQSWKISLIRSNEPFTHSDDIMLSRERTILFARKTVDWHGVEKLGGALCLTNSRTLLLDDPQEILYNGIEVVRDIDVILNQRASKHLTLPKELVSIREKFKVSEPIDCVYGVIGLLSPEYQARISIDYSVTNARARLEHLCSTCRVCLQSDPSLSLLSLVDLRDRSAQLPSWCPSFELSTVGENPLVFRYSAGVGPGNETW